MTIQYSVEVLEQTPERVAKFLTTIGAIAEVRTLLYKCGLTDAEIIEGRERLLACMAAPRDSQIGMDTVDAARVREAIAEIDQLDEQIFSRTHAVARRFNPSAEEYLFHDLKATQGSASVHGMATYLTRLTALEKGNDPQRSAFIAADAELIKILAERGIDQKERGRLSKLVEIALSPTNPLPKQNPALLDQQRREKLAALKTWFDDWATMARTVVQKRAHLISLGLAKRKFRSDETVSTEDIPSNPTDSKENP